MKLSRERIAVAEVVTVATVEVIAVVVAVVIAAEIASNASRGGKKLCGEKGKRVKGNRASLSGIPSYFPFTLLPFYPFISLTSESA
jgi:hypothetical protein